MCNFGHDHNGDFGFIVDVPEIRALIDEVRRVSETIATNAVHVDTLRPAFARLLAAEGWLPDVFAQPASAVVWAGESAGPPYIERKTGRSACFRSSCRQDVSTPVHDHLAWGLVGVYRGTQLDTTYGASG